MPGRLRTWLDRHDPGQSVQRVLFYRFVRMVTWMLLTLLYRNRMFHTGRVPPAGPLLIVANHQSHLDPPIVGTALRHRHVVPLARIGLFSSPFFGRLISALNAIAIKQSESDTAAVRRALAELTAGRAILIFPEGSRTFDGSLQPFQPGAWLLIRRARCTVLPIAVEGAFHAWPRTRPLPRLFGRRVGTAVGEPIRADELIELGPTDGVALLVDRIEALRAELRAHMNRAP